MGFQAATTTQSAPQGDEGSTDRLSDQSDRPILAEPEHTATFKDYLVRLIKAFRLFYGAKSYFDSVFSLTQRIAMC